MLNELISACLDSYEKANEFLENLIKDSGFDYSSGASSISLPRKIVPSGEQSSSENSSDNSDLTATGNKIRSLNENAIVENSIENVNSLLTSSLAAEEIAYFTECKLKFLFNNQTKN